MALLNAGQLLPEKPRALQLRQLIPTVVRSHRIVWLRERHRPTQTRHKVVGEVTQHRGAGTRRRAKGSLFDFGNPLPEILQGSKGQLEFDLKNSGRLDGNCPAAFAPAVQEGRAQRVVVVLGIRLDAVEQAFSEDVACES